jgi:hypothetical protein
LLLYIGWWFLCKGGGVAAPSQVIFQL